MGLEFCNLVVWVLDSVLRFVVWCLGFGILEFGLWSLCFSIWDFEFGVWDFEFWSLRIWVFFFGFGICCFMFGVRNLGF